MSPEELEALNYRYPSCCTCLSRGVRTHKVGKRKTAETTWCELHNRPVEYEYFTGRDGKQWIASDRPCPEYAYVGSSPLSRERRLLQPGKKRAC
jgi:hypothetical protein